VEIDDEIGASGLPSSACVCFAFFSNRGVAVWEAERVEGVRIRFVPRTTRVFRGVFESVSPDCIAASLDFAAIKSTWEKTRQTNAK
jgi:hypothetical protein